MPDDAPEYRRIATRSRFVAGGAEVHLQHQQAVRKSIPLRHNKYVMLFRKYYKISVKKV